MKNQFNWELSGRRWKTDFRKLTQTKQHSCSKMFENLLEAGKRRVLQAWPLPKFSWNSWKMCRQNCSALAREWELDASSVLSFHQLHWALSIFSASITSRFRIIFFTVPCSNVVWMGSAFQNKLTPTLESSTQRRPVSKTASNAFQCSNH